MSDLQMQGHINAIYLYTCCGYKKLIHCGTYGRQIVNWNNTQILHQRSIQQHR